MIGLNALAAAAPDGYTLGYFSTSQFLEATLSNRYALEKDFTPIIMVGLTPLILVANAGTGIKTLKQMIEAAKAKPKSLNYGSGGSGGLLHFAMEFVLKEAKIDVVHVPYKGAGPALVDLLGGQVQLAVTTPAAVMPYVKSGQVNALAVTGEVGTSLAPGVPTFSEAGMRNINFSTWYGLFGPSKMAPELVDKIARSVTSAALPLSVKKRFADEGLDLAIKPPGDFARSIKDEREQWLQLARDIKFTKEK